MASNEQNKRSRMIDRARVRDHTPLRISTYSLRTLGCTKNMLDIIAIQERRL